MTHSTGPDVAIPSSWGQPQDNPGRPSGSGYSVNHTQYSTERERWAKLSYALPPIETITLDISAVHEVSARRKGHWVAIGVCFDHHSFYQHVTHLSIIIEHPGGQKRC
jgi:hypothetical protein